jgi:hypothetical protein
MARKELNKFNEDFKNAENKEQVVLDFIDKVSKNEDLRSNEEIRKSIIEKSHQIKAENKFKK